LEFCFSMIDPKSRQHALYFVDMFNDIHVLEKLFIIKITQKYYWLPFEEQLHCVVQSRRFIMKVMFFIIVARPKFTKT